MRLKLQVLALFIVTGCISSCAPKELYQSIWKSTPAQADGRTNEWPVPLKYYDTETKLNYTIANDRENLYLCIRVGDDLSQFKILKTGLQLWIDTTGKKQHQVGLLFPYINQDQLQHSGRKKETQEMTAESSRNDMEKRRKRLLAAATEMQLIGFHPPAGGIMPVSNAQGIKGAVNWDSSGVMIYELVLPFKTFYHAELRDKDTLKTFGLSITSKAMEMAIRSGGGNTGMSMGMGAGGGMGMGMRGGGMGGGGNRRMQSDNGDGREAFAETKSFWIPFKLAGPLK